MSHPGLHTKTKSIPKTRIRRFQVRNDFLSLLYFGFLREFSFDETARFWEACPLKIGGKTLTGRKLYEHISDPGRKTGFECVFKILNALEPFFIAHHRDCKAFLREMILNLRHGASLAPSFALWAVMPLMRRFLESRDPRSLLLSAIQTINSRARPGTLQKCIRTVKRGATYHALILFSPDPTFKREFTAVDGELFFAQTLQCGPARLGLAPFDSYSMIAECQTALQRVSEHVAELKDGVFFLADEMYGKQCMFSDFCSRRDIDPGMAIPDRSVIVVERDYRCPKRKRIVLHAGCAYGAPVYMYEMKYRGSPATPSFRQIIEDSLEAEPANSEISDLHRAFLASRQCRLEFTFDYASEYVLLNGTYLTRGIQARILAYMLDNYQRGKSSFSYAELASDPSLISHPSNTGLAIRLSRLQKILRDACPALSITPTRRGGFELECTGNLRYSVRNDTK
jgi:hypothetical protein